MAVLPDAGTQQRVDGRGGQSKGVVELATGEEFGVAGDSRAIELQFDLAIEMNAEWVVLAVNLWVSRTLQQEGIGIIGIPNVPAKITGKTPKSAEESRLKKRNPSGGNRPAANRAQARTPGTAAVGCLHPGRPVGESIQGRDLAVPFAGSDARRADCTE